MINILYVFCSECAWRQITGSADRCQGPDQNYVTSLEQKGGIFSGTFPNAIMYQCPSLDTHCLSQNCTVCDFRASTHSLKNFWVLLYVPGEVSSFLSAFLHQPQAVLLLPQLEWSGFTGLGQQTQPGALKGFCSKGNMLSVRDLSTNHRVLSFQGAMAGCYYFSLEDF